MERSIISIFITKIHFSQKELELLFVYLRDFMRTKLVIRMIGVSLLLEAAMMLFSAMVAAHGEKDPSFVPLLFSAVIVGIFGAFPRIFVRDNSSDNHRITIKEGYYIVVGSWVFACVFGTIPYLMYGGEFTVINALFESVSGFTTTGASVLSDIEALPSGLLFWRMSTAWMGGIGIVALFSMVIPAGSGNGAVLTGVEVSGIARDDASTREKSLVKMMVTTYLVLTAVLVFVLKLCGMRWFDALTHAMSTAATCGFSTKNLSIAYYNSPLIETVLAVFMVLASINFCLIYSLFTRDKQKNLFQSEVSRSFLCVVALCVVVVALNLLCSGTYTSVAESLRKAFFHVAAFISTTGFSSADSNLWPAMSMVVLIGCSIVCGCSGSTSGGMKFDRMLVCFKSVRAKLKALANPNQVNVVKVDRRPISENRVSDSKTFMAIYFFIIAIGALINTGFGMDILSGFSASVACLGNVGPGFGQVGVMSNYSQLPWVLKLTDSFLMLLGRLEIFSLFYVLRIQPKR